MATSTRNTNGNGNGHRIDALELIADAKSELREEIDQKLKAVSELGAYRYDERTRTLEQMRLLIQHQLEAHEKLIEERIQSIIQRFGAIEMRFGERDIRNNSMQTTSAAAISAAMAAQKELSTLVQSNTAEAITKSETAFNSRIAALEALLSATKDSFIDRMGEISRRIDRADGNRTGEQTGAQSTTTTITTVVAVVGGVVGILSFLIALAVLASNSEHSGASAQLASATSQLAAATPPIGIDSKRVDDLVSRLNALSLRMDQFTTPATPGPGPTGLPQPTLPNVTR